MKESGKVLTVIVALAGLFSLTAQAANFGTDNANQAVYDNGWQTGDDGSASGDAFAGWTLGTFDAANHFIGDSTQLSSPGADINVNSESWQLFAGNPGFAFADRSFNGGALSVGQTFTIELAVNFRNGFKGLDLKSGGTTIWNFNVGGDDYTVDADGSGGGAGASIGDSYSANTEFLLSFTQTSAGGGTWSVTRSGGVADLDSGSFSGTPDNIRLYIGNTDGGSPNDLYANSMAIVPEPTAALLVGMGLAGATMLRRRKA